MKHSSSTCLFCKAPLAATNRTREHVIARWLIDYLGQGSTTIEPTHSSTDGVVLSRRKHDLNNLTEGRICAECNHGWMSKLEQTVQPLISQLHEGSIGFEKLSLEQRRALAKWATKTAWMLHTASNYPAVVPPDHLHELGSPGHHLPKNVLVLGSRVAAGTTISWIQSSTWLADLESTTTEDQFRSLAKSAYKVGLRFGSVQFVVAHWPHEGWTFKLWAPLHCPLWPERGRVVWTKGSPSESQLAADSIWSTHVFVELVQNGRLTESPYTAATICTSTNLDVAVT